MELCFEHEYQLELFLIQVIIFLISHKYKNLFLSCKIISIIYIILLNKHKFIKSHIQ